MSLLSHEEADGKTFAFLLWSLLTILM